MSAALRSVEKKKKSLFEWCVIMLSINLHLDSPRQTRLWTMWKNSLSRNGCIEREAKHFTPAHFIKMSALNCFREEMRDMGEFFLWLTHWDFCFTTAVFNWNTLAILKIKAIRQMHEKCEEEENIF